MTWADTPWAKRRQTWIAGILIAIAVVLVALIIVSVLYKAPSCVDHTQNQGEQGIDCGGPCAYLCSADELAPSVRFVRAVFPGAGTTDIIAYIDNPNKTAGAQAASYTVDLYGAHNQILAEKTGTVNLLPGTTAPVFIPNMYVGNNAVGQAFLTFKSDSVLWFRSNTKIMVPQPSAIFIQNLPLPKVTATLTNPSGQTIYNEKVIATVFDAANNAVGASQTVIQTFPAQGSVPVVFTWNQPFPKPPARVEILPATGP